MIVVIGVGGQLGQEYIKVLSSKNINFIPLKKKDLDISKFDDVYKTIKKIKPSVVINCSAYNQVDLAELDFVPAYQTNSIGPYNLAIACKEVGAKLVHYSTDYVFDGKNKRLYIEEDKPNPLNQYGLSKLLGEEFIKQVMNENFLIFRTSWVYGNGTQNFIYKILQWIEGNDVLQIAFNEVSVPTFTGFLVEKSLKAIEKEIHGLFHLVPNGYTSRYEWAKLTFKLLGISKTLIPVNKEIFEPLAKRPDFSPMSPKKIEKKLGETFEEWDEILKNEIVSIKTNYNL